MPLRVLSSHKFRREDALCLSLHRVLLARKSVTSKILQFTDCKSGPRHFSRIETFHFNLHHYSIHNPIRLNMAGSATTPTSSTAPQLKRSLTLWDLILYGVIVIQPVAPMSVFGVLSNRGHGHVVTTILIAMVAMLFTAISYGRMARAYPSAGSAF